MIKWLACIIMLLITLAISCCSPAQGLIETKTPINVSLNGIKVGELTLSDLAQLEQIPIKINGVVKSGPTLQTIVDHIGIISYMGVTISGYSRDRSKELSKELTEYDFTTDTIFTVSKDTVAIFGLNIPSEYWDMEVTNIFVIACECGL